MSRRRAHLIKATADARSRWPSLLLAFAAAALASALASGGLLALTSVEHSLVATTRALGTPQLWMQGRLSTLNEARGRVEELSGGSTILIPQGRGAIRAGSAELRAGLRPLQLPRPAAEHLAIVVGDWPEGGSDGVVIERGAARSLGVQGLPATVRVAGPAGEREFAVAAIVRDVSQAAYPLSTPALAYLPADAWDDVVGDGAEVALMGVTVAAGRELRPVALAISESLPPDAERAIYASRWVIDGLAPVTISLAGFMLLFGLVALLATAFYSASATIAEIMQRSREIGVLQATGWSRADIAAILRLPRLAACGLGALIGASTGVAIAVWATDQLVSEMGLEPHMDGWLWLPVVVLGVTATSWASTALGLRRVIGAAPAVALAGGVRSLPGRIARTLQSLPLPFSARLGATLLLARTRVLLVSALVLVLGIMTTMFAGIAVTTVDRFSTDPSVWGYDYDWQVRMIGASDRSVGTALDDLVGSSRVEPVYVSKLLIGTATRADIKFITPNSEAVRVGLLSGELPRDDTEILVGAGAARTHAVGPGSLLEARLEGTPVRLRISGVYRELEGLGQWFLGREGLYRTVRADPPVAYYVVRLPDPALETQVRAELDARTEGRAVVTSVRAAIEFPFRDSLRRVLFGLAAALLILAATLVLSTLLVVAAEHAYAVAVLRALGASMGTVSGIVLSGAAVLILPAALIGTTVGVLGSSQLLSALGAQIGGVDVVISPALLLGLLLAAVLPAAAGFLAPPLLALRHAPIRGLHAER